MNLVREKESGLNPTCEGRNRRKKYEAKTDTFGSQGSGLGERQLVSPDVGCLRILRRHRDT